MRLWNSKDLLILEAKRLNSWYFHVNQEISTKWLMYSIWLSLNNDWAIVKILFVKHIYGIGSTLLWCVHETFLRNRIRNLEKQCPTQKHRIENHKFINQLFQEHEDKLIYDLCARDNIRWICIACWKNNNSKANTLRERTSSSDTLNLLGRIQTNLRNLFLTNASCTQHVTILHVM